MGRGDSWADDGREERVEGESVGGAVKLHALLLEALALEHKYQPALALQQSTKDCSEISMRMRNGSAHVLRCLKVWYDIPPETFFNAVNIMDRFLTRMRAQPKHLSCIAVSAFHLSCEITRLHVATPFEVPERPDLTMISQCKCGPGDVKRMEGIMAEKLDTDMRCQMPVTPLTLLRLLHAAHTHITTPHLMLAKEEELDSVGCAAAMGLTALTHQLEIVACDAMAAMYRPSEVALALLTLRYRQDTQRGSLHQAVLEHLYDLCKISDSRFDNCYKVVSSLIHDYENKRQSPHRQRLVWKLSNRTLRQLRPTAKLKGRLPTIKEVNKTPPPHPIAESSLEETCECESPRAFLPLCCPVSPSLPCSPPPSPIIPDSLPPNQSSSEAILPSDSLSPTSQMDVEFDYQPTEASQLLPPSPPLSPPSLRMDMVFDYELEFPPLPEVGVRSPRKSAISSPHKKPPPALPYPRIWRKCGRSV